MASCRPLLGALVALGAAPLLTSISGLPARANPLLGGTGGIYGFSCVQTGGNYYIGLGNLPTPAGNVAMNSSAVLPLLGSGMVPVVRITSSIGNYAIDRRCSTIATRLTNLALATGNATPKGIFNLVNFLVPGQIGNQQVIAIDKLTAGDVLATVGNGMSASKAISVLGQRIQRVAARQAIANSLQDGDIVIFEFVEITR
jgi:hypothetical protein